MTSEFEHLRADDAVLAARRDLAERVRAALMYAGVPAFPSTGALVSAGAEIEIDAASDEAGGVYVYWAPSGELSKAVRDNWMAGRTNAPVVELFESISLAMRDALIEIVRRSGFRVLAVDDYAMGPPAIFVLGSNDEGDGTRA
ncbi:hypothetical protein [Catellatospora vulcania]|uniref:hypothetical protein n=1 Tax=Catellatospora vulcania TaxID=1460450 RepID=UPI0012D435D6|nr:hypothetical protein [Catellatospora vulcania]